MTGRSTAIDSLIAFGPAARPIRVLGGCPLILIAVVAIGLSACARSGPPAPVVYGSGGPAESQSTGQRANNGAADLGSRSDNRQVDRSGRASAPETTRSRDTGSQPADQAQNRRTTANVNWARTGRAGIHTVAKGDSVYGLARRYQVPIRAIIDANDLEPPYTLYVGQEIRIPVPRRHVVERGDTVYGISRAYGVDMSELTRLNDIQPPYEITPGQVLVIPGRGREAAPTRTAGQSDGAQTSTASADRSTAQSRQTGQARDRRDEAEQTAVASLPSAPAGTPTPPQPPARKTEPSGKTQTAQAGQNAQTPESQPQARAEPAAAPQPKSIPQPPPRAEARFLWPVRGKVLSSFGPMDGGLHNDGINIAAPEGTPVKASENGVVAYVGNELRGFGNLLLIKHADGWVTAYAHTQEILVSHGEQVKRGQLVARVGATGSVAQPQLHFEIRQGSKAKDPAKLLGSQQASR
jgi:murein DD-endopeptidase MepM/ murein hydrolase activator NlpD